MSVEKEHEDFEAAFDAAVEGKELDEETEVEEAEETEETEVETEEAEESEEENEVDETTDDKEEIDVEALIRERDDYKQKFQSNNGRISAYQRQLDELQQSNAHLASQIAKSVDDTGSKSEAREQIAGEISNQSWDELKEDMPDVAAAIDERLKAMIDDRIKPINEKIQPISQSLQEQRQREAEARFERELAVVKDRHPDFDDVVRSSEFSEWLGQQPEPVQQLQNSDSAADAAYLLDTFKLQTSTEPSGSDLKQRNQAKLRNSLAAPSKRLSRTAPSLDDFDAAFDAAVARDRR